MTVLTASLAMLMYGPKSKLSQLKLYALGSEVFVLSGLSCGVQSANLILLTLF